MTVLSSNGWAKGLSHGGRYWLRKECDSRERWGFLRALKTEPPPTYVAAQLCPGARKALASRSVTFTFIGKGRTA